MARYRLAMFQFAWVNIRNLLKDIKSKIRKKYLQMLNQIYFRTLFVFFYIAAFAGCAYNFGSAKRSIPGGYQSVAIPVFKNKTYEVGVEVPFTNALINEFERTRIAKVVDSSLADVIVYGTVESVEYKSLSQKTSAQLPSLPEGAVLTTEYAINITATIVIRKASDQSVVWAGQVLGEKNYTAPQVAAPIVNSVNSLYNLSARRQNIDVISLDMMAEAYDRMTENF